VIFFFHLPAVSSATFSRHGGVSKAPYHSCNVGLHVGDAEERVLRNRALLREQLGLARLISASKAHNKLLLKLR